MRAHPFQKHEQSLQLLYAYPLIFCLKNSRIVYLFEFFLDNWTKNWVLAQCALLIIPMRNWFWFAFWHFLQVRNALKEQQEVNASLRDYIDRILNNIICQHPELLEVKIWWLPFSKNQSATYIPKRIITFVTLLSRDWTLKKLISMITNQWKKTNKMLTKLPTHRSLAPWVIN